MNYNGSPKTVIDFECTACKRQNTEVGKVPVRRIIEKLDNCFKINDLKSATELLEHWQNEAVGLNDLSGELSVVNEMLGLYRKTDNREKGIGAVKRAIELLEKTNSNGISGATIMINAATTSKAFGNPEAALPLYEKAEAIYRQGLPDSDLRFAALYNNYATALVDLKRFDEAKALYFKAVRLTEKEVDSLLDCAVSYVNLAHLYEVKEGSLSPNIEKCLEQAEKIFDDNRIPKDSYYAFVCEKCAPSFDYFGFFITAAKLNKISREIYEGT